MHTIINQYSHSSKQIQLLAEKQLATGMKRSIKLHSGSITRWLTRSRMSHEVWVSFLALVGKAHEQQDYATMELLVAQNFVLGVAFHADLTGRLAQLSLARPPG